MGCSCHDPAVFGHLECKLAPPGLVTEQIAEMRQRVRLSEMTIRETVAIARKRRLLERDSSRYCRTHDLYECPYNH